MTRDLTAYKMLLEWQARIDSLSPMPRRIFAHHSVPYGRCYRQWMTNGDLVVWANRGEIADLPRATLPPEGLTWPMLHLDGIAVVYVP